MSTSIHILATLEANPGKEKELEAVLRSMLDPTRAEAGCIRYELLHDPASPSLFLFVEEWADEGALEAHGQAEHLKEAGQKMGGLLAGRPDIQRLRSIAS